MIAGSGGSHPSSSLKKEAGAVSSATRNTGTHVVVWTGHGVRHPSSSSTGTNGTSSSSAMTARMIGGPGGIGGDQKSSSSGKVAVSSARPKSGTQVGVGDGQTGFAQNSSSTVSGVGRS